jgi:dTDP-4-amino-4,6-dideoxygalactose transaminase
MQRRDQFLPFGRPDFGDAEIDAVTRVLRSGWVGMGQETLAFERELAEAVRAPHVVTVNSCTSALFLSLLTLGVGPGDDVICPSLTWCSTASVVVHLGARPVFCDVNPDTLALTPETVRPHVTGRTRAVIAVHMGGLTVNVSALRDALPPRVAIVEDAAHALGSAYTDGSPVGSSGNLTCFSFYANKNLSTGEGGAVALADGDVADRLRSLRQHGLPTNAWQRYSQPNVLADLCLREIGYKANFTDLQAAIGRVQLRRQPEMATRRLAVAERYVARLGAASPSPQFQARVLHPGHARHLFVVRLPIGGMHLTRDQALAAMRERNIGASIHYPPLHRMPVYGSQAVLPYTERLAQRILTLPISASMSVDDADDVAGHLTDVLSGARHERMAS